MEQLVLTILSLLGCIALFLYGMRTMSQGILKVGGSRMRAMMRNISAKNPLQGFSIGAWITMLIQSSSAMTIMAVSLVNAGLLSLSQSISVIMGANVGTTATAWLIAIFCYLLPAGTWAIPLIVLAIPFLFSSRPKRKPWGEVIIGASLLIFGFSMFETLLPPPEESSSLWQNLSALSQAGYLSILLFMVFGILTTILFQSSAATIMLAMMSCAQGWIVFPMAAAMVIGDNLGTTLTAVAAARKANVSARRASYAHLIFNVVGLIWSLVLFFPLTHFVVDVFVLMDIPLAAQLALSVAFYHTSFNLVTAMATLWLIPLFDKMLCTIIPLDVNDEEEFHLAYIRGGLLPTSELGLVEARKETILFGDRVQRMLLITLDFMHLSSDNVEESHTFSRIEKYEKITDRLEMEIVRYLNNLDKSGISEHVALCIRSLFKTVDELESIGDSCYNLARSIMRKRSAKIEFTEDQQANIGQMCALTKDVVNHMVKFLHNHGSMDITQGYELEDKVNALRNQLREQNIGNVQNGLYTYQSGIIYMDIIGECEKLCDFVINVLEAFAEQKNSQSVA